ncbi:MAG: Zn-dependent hydrolase [Bacteroidetes bacterium HGW-Bacteroidetes-21]|nr:MAG: Zn-dependent hydrolase [Bacteroidetes bacterium HGW-Bacteroidetes-21]
MDIDLKTAERLMKDKVGDFATVKLTADISHLTASEKAVLPLLFDAAKIMDELYWIQACPDKADILAKITDENAKKYFDINYGPWDILDNFKPFVDGVGKKPDGVNFYPKDMTKEEFEALEDPAKNSWYTVIIRDENKKLKVVPYHEYYSPKIQEAANLLKEAAKLADNPELKKYLELRAVALETGNYFDSDMAWMDMKSTNIDFVIGPIESYEDALFGNKTSFESFVLIKDPEWSSKLERFSKLLPEMQKSLPVDEKYKKDVPGKDSDMGVYYALYYAGDCNSGSKTIAINLPNDKEINAKKGSRKLQLKNSMQAKFDQILVPISNVLICEEQRKHVKFDAFFENTMFHEIAHGLGVSKTINGKGLVTEALKDQHTALEEGKADIGGLYLITKLHEMGEIKDKELMDNYVTFMAGIFRSIRFGAASAHGKANLVRYYYFEEKQAFTRDEKTGTYKIDFEKMKAAVSDLTNLIIVLQGEGDYDGAKKMMDEKGVMGQTLKSDLARIAKSNIPKDIVFEQGKELLNL